MPLTSSTTSQFSPLYDRRVDSPESDKEIIQDFYHRVIAKFTGAHLASINKQVKLIVVGHLVPTLPFYLQALNKIASIAAIVPKGSVPDPKVISWLKDWLPAATQAVDGKPTVIVDKDYMRVRKEKLFAQVDTLLPDQVKRFRLPVDKDGQVEKDKLGVRELLAVSAQELIKEWLSDSNKKAIIIDIGGYFAPCLEFMKDSGVLGIVEDTENGHQLYRSVLDLLFRENKQGNVPPIISVARSQIKDAEDHNVGKAITLATDSILRKDAYTYLGEAKTILIIGYGKIGQAAADTASRMTRGAVLVCEKDDVRALKASSHSFTVVDTLEDGLREADVIISCTGAKCLEEKHIPYLKKGVYIASCTSRDGEFADSFLRRLDETKNREKLRSSVNSLSPRIQDEEKGISHITAYTIGNNIIHLLNEGNSVNFVQKAVHGYFIHGVLASLAVAAIEVAKTGLGLKDPFSLKREVLNDFNDLFVDNREDGNKRSLSYQSLIAKLLMQEKLRTEPLLTNFFPPNESYFAREEELKLLHRELNASGRVSLYGSKRYGSAQLISQFYALNNNRYDIVWKFDALSSLEEQFTKLALFIGMNTRLVSRREAIEPGVSVANVVSMLEKEDISYLLIFENVDSMVHDSSEKHKISERGKALSTFIPKQSYNKREHIILTSNSEGSLRELGFTSQVLRPIETLDLFKILVNDESLWNEEEDNLKRVAYSFARPEKLYQGEVNLPYPEDEEVFINISRVFAAVVKNFPAFNWREYLPSKNIGHYIKFFFKSIFQYALSSKSKILLVFFYAEEDMPFMDMIKVRESARKGGFLDELEALVKLGLIEESQKGYSRVINRLSANTSFTETRRILEEAVPVVMEKTSEEILDSLLAASLLSFSQIVRIFTPIFKDISESLRLKM